MAVILAQVVMESVTGLSEDRYVNTFTFNGAATTPKAEQIVDNLEDFYNAADVGDNSIAQFLGSAVSRAADAVTVKCYDITAGPGGTPFHEGTFTMGASLGGGTMPNECALCLSFKANPLAGAVEARRRGRIYLGPLDLNALNDATGGPVPDPDLIEALLDGANRLHANSDTNATPWVVYSRVNDTTALVDVAWVDNAFDTQRRRGRAATARTTLIL